MRRRLFHLLLLPLLFLTIVVWNKGSMAAESAKAESPKRLLVIHSYHEGYDWVQGINEGIMKALKDRQDIKIKFFYMDTKRNTSIPWKVRAGKEARSLIEDWDPDVVIACDDNAQIYVTQHYIGQDRFFVFCGVNNDPVVYGFPAKNVTGILEKPHFDKSMELLRSIVPRIRRVVMIGDKSPSCLGAMDYVADTEHDVVVWRYSLIEKFSVWKKRVEEFGVISDAICIYLYHTIKPDKGSDISMDPSEVVKWTVRNTNIPTVGFFDFSIRDGLLCGVVESGEEHGFEAGHMAVGLLNGEPMSEYPILRATKGKKMINLNTARRLGIDIPEDKLRELFDEVVE